MFGDRLNLVDKGDSAFAIFSGLFQAHKFGDIYNTAPPFGSGLAAFQIDEIITIDGIIVSTHGVFHFRFLFLFLSSSVVLLHLETILDRGMSEGSYFFFFFSIWGNL